MKSAPVKLAPRKAPVPSSSAATALLSPIGRRPTTAAALRPVRLIRISAQTRSRQAAKPEVSGTGRTGARDLEPAQVMSATCQTSQNRTFCADSTVHPTRPQDAQSRQGSGRSRSRAVIAPGHDRLPRSPCEIRDGRLRNVDSPRWWPRMTGFRMRATRDTQRGGRAPGGTAATPPAWSFRLPGLEG